VVRSAAVGGLDPVTRATRTIAEYKPIFLRYHRVEGNTKDTYANTLRLHVIPFLGEVRLAETDRTVARNHSTALEEAGRSANTIRLRPSVLDLHLAGVRRDAAHTVAAQPARLSRWSSAGLRHRRAVPRRGPP
jgi:hypothetical protein